MNKTVTAVLIILALILGIYMITVTEKTGTDLPPPPPKPGGTDFVGRAAGITIMPEERPGWAAPPRLVTISADTVSPGETLRMTIGDIYDRDNYDYAWTIAYELNKHLFTWEALNADISGYVRENWAEDYATFDIEAPDDPGIHYLLGYACTKIDEEWECNGGVGQQGKWMLMAYEVEEPETIAGYTIISTTEVGPTTTTRLTYQGTRVDVLISEYASYDALLQAAQGTDLSMWTTQGSVCGFLTSAAGRQTFWWASNKYKVTVITYADSVATPIIQYYKPLYPPTCTIYNDLQPTPQAVCGNDIREAQEQCDGTDDTFCPGQCQADCTCAITPFQPLGYCGDGTVQTPNNETPAINEQCELPSRYDAQGQFIQGDNCMTAQGIAGICDQHCQCSTGAAPTSVCGDGQIHSPNSQGILEECETNADCGPGQKCRNCGCIPGGCGDGFKAPNEMCESVADCPVFMGKAATACQACNCLYPVSVCGNGHVEPGEGCDDGNNVGGDGCDANCQPEICGNGKLDPLEMCDPPGQLCPAGQKCDANCLCIDSCGDGILDAGEGCDDGNKISGDGCDANCQPEAIICGNGRMDPGEQCETNNPCPGNQFCNANNCQCQNRPEPIQPGDPGWDESFNLTAGWCGDGQIQWQRGEECDAGKPCQYAGYDCDENCKCVQALQHEGASDLNVGPGTENPTGMVSTITSAVSKDIIQNSRQYLIFLIAAIALLIITFVNIRCNEHPDK